MNERIKELAEQAGASYYNTYTGPLLSPKDIEKFAELIVQECILVIEEEAEHIHAEGTIEAIVNLEKHFGVE
jgi:hypothetical protein